MKETTLVLIVARPGPLRNSLQTLLTTMPEIEIVAEARDVIALLKMGPELQPDLVMIDATYVKNRLQEVLIQLHRKWPAVRCIVLVETKVEQNMAETAGANAVLFKGYRATDLIRLIQDKLISQKAVENQREQG
jgi:DNA-binding NarL/FixJ family response regulator